MRSKWTNMANMDQQKRSRRSHCGSKTFAHNSFENMFLSQDKHLRCNATNFHVLHLLLNLWWLYSAQDLLKSLSNRFHLSRHTRCFQMEHFVFYFSLSRKHTKNRNVKKKIIRWNQSRVLSSKTICWTAFMLVHSNNTICICGEKTIAILTPRARRHTSSQRSYEELIKQSVAASRSNEAISNSTNAFGGKLVTKVDCTPTVLGS